MNVVIGRAVPAGNVSNSGTLTGGGPLVQEKPAPSRPLDPRTRALIIGIRAALLMVVDALGEYAGVPPRTAA